MTDSKETLTRFSKKILHEVEIENNGCGQQRDLNSQHFHSFYDLEAETIQVLKDHGSNKSNSYPKYQKNKKKKTFRSNSDLKKELPLSAGSKVSLYDKSNACRKCENPSASCRVKEKLDDNEFDDQAKDEAVRKLQRCFKQWRNCKLKLKSSDKKSGYQQKIENEQNMRTASKIDNFKRKKMEAEKDRLFLSDGKANRDLRVKIDNALKSSRFDSISKLINMDENHTLNENVLFLSKQKQDQQRCCSCGNKKLVSTNKLQEKKHLNVQKKIASNNIKFDNPESLTVKDIRYDGLEKNSIAATRKKQQELNDGKNIKLGRNHEICFNCWSAGEGEYCKVTLQKNDSKEDSSDETSAYCENWGMKILRRRYRAEEIQQLYEKEIETLIYHQQSKSFRTRMEHRHPIYQTLQRYVERNYDNSYEKKLRIHAWFRSFVILFQRKRIPGLVMEGHRFKRAREIASCRITTKNLIDLRKIKKETLPLMLHNNRTKRKVTTEEKTWSVPIPCILFEAKKYNFDNYEPLTTPLLSSAIWQVVEPYVQSASKNGLVDKKNPFAWTKYLSSTLLSNDNPPICTEQQSILSNILFPHVAISKSIENEISVNDNILSPINEHRVSMKFVIIHRKQTPNNMAVGGLPMEIRVTQLLRGVIPPCFGDFICTDKTMIIPNANSKSVTSSSFEIEQFVNYRYNDLEELSHALNSRIAPSIMVVTGMADPNEKYHYGLNRPKQTGEESSFGFRTSESNDIDFHSSLDDSILPTSFIPSHDIVTFNNPTEHKSMIMRADNHYPFREPKSRTRTTQDFRHLLLINRNKSISPRNKPQIFTTIGVQESGQYMRQSDPSRPLGFFRSKVIRSWAYVQQQSYRVHEYEAEDNTSYWYDKTTKEVYKSRPKFQEEDIPIRDGGIIFIDDEKTNDDEKDSELRDFFRKMIMFPHETESMRRIRYKAARKNGLTPKIIQEQEQEKEQEHHPDRQTHVDNESKNEIITETLTFQPPDLNQSKRYEMDENYEKNTPPIIGVSINF